MQEMGKVKSVYFITSSLNNNANGAAVSQSIELGLGTGGLPVQGPLGQLYIRSVDWWLERHPATRHRTSTVLPGRLEGAAFSL